jgi:carboxylesterase
MVLLAPFVRVFQPPLLSVPTGDLVRKLDFLPWVPRRRPPLRDPAVRDEVARCAWFKTFNLHATRSALQLIDVVMAEAKSITTPTLIIQGRRDTVVAPPGAEMLLARLGGPKSLVWMDQSDHLLTLDVDAESVLAEATRFLSEPEPR